MTRREREEWTHEQCTGNIDQRRERNKTTGKGRQKGKRSKEAKMGRHGERTRTDTKEVEERRKAVGSDQTGTKTGVHNPSRESPTREADTQEESTSSTYIELKRIIFMPGFFTRTPAGSLVCVNSRSPS